MFELPLLYLVAVAYCVVLGLWRIPRHVRRYRGLSIDAVPWAFAAGATAATLSWIVPGALTLAGIHSARWILVAALVLDAWLDTRRSSVDFAEGRKAAQLAASFEYVQGRARPTAIDYALALLFVSYRTIVPAAILIFDAPE